MSINQYQDELVSIVTPIYNGEGYVAETVRAIQAQTYQNWELLITDDCSKDGTASILQEFARLDHRIKPLRTPVNSGPANARKTSLQQARGRYLALCDGDDVWLPEKLERQLNFMQKSGIVYSYTQYRRINKTGDTVGHLIAGPKQMTYRKLLRYTAIATSTIIIDRATVGDVDFVNAYYDDMVFKLDVLKRGFVAYGLEEDLMRYRVVTNSVSRNKINSAMQVWHTYRDIEKLGLMTSIWSFIGYGYYGFVNHFRF